MTDKVQKIRAEIERRKETLKPCGGQGLVVTRLMRELCDDFLSFIDSMQLEEIPPKFPLISPKKCMYTKDDFTDEDRKVLCDGCKEKCEYSKKEEPAPKIFEDMLNAKTPAESLGISAEEHDKIIDLCLYGKEPEMVDIDDLPKEEPVSKDLEGAIDKYLDNGMALRLDWKQCNITFKASKLINFADYIAKWQKQQLMANAVEGVVHHFEKCKVASVHYNDPTGVPMAYFTSPEGLSAGDKVKIIVIKED